MGGAKDRPSTLQILHALRVRRIGHYRSSAPLQITKHCASLIFRSVINIWDVKIHHLLLVGIEVILRTNKARDKS
jgi:hypothetical protein